MIVVRRWLVLTALALPFPGSLTAQSGAPAAPVGARAMRLVQTLGDGERDGDAYTLSSIQSLQVAPSGQVFVLDRIESDIKMFDARGKYVRTFGRRGAGPGELTGPSFRTRISDSELVVTDNMLRRDVRFSLAGRHLRTVAHPPSGEADVPSAVFPLAGGGRLEVVPPSVVAFDPDVFVHVLFRRQGARSVDTLARIRSDLVTFNRPGRKGTVLTSIAPSHAGQGGAWAVAGDSMLAIIDGYGGTVRWFDTRGAVPAVVRTARLPGSSVPTTRGEFAPVKRQLERSWQKIQPGVSITLVDVPPRRSIATGALFATDGSLWVSALPTARGTAWTVYASRGAPFTVQVPPGEQLSAVHGRRLYTIATSVDDLPVVRVYELAA